PEGQVARVLAVSRFRVLEVAGGIPVALPAHVAEELVVTGAPVEAVGGVEARGRAPRRPGRAAVRIVDQAPGPEAVLPAGGPQDPVPVDEHAQPLLEDVGVEPAVPGGGLVPDLPARDLRAREASLPRPEAGVGGLIRPAPRIGGVDRGRLEDAHRWSVGTGGLRGAGGEQAGQEGQDDEAWFGSCPQWPGD